MTGHRPFDEIRPERKPEVVDVPRWVDWVIISLDVVGFGLLGYVIWILN